MIGELYAEMGTEEKAEEFFKRSIDISSKIDARPERAAACFDLGLLYKKKNRIYQAREFLRQAQEIYRTIDTPDQESVKKEILTLEGSF
jgi:tetratricopeptide (TPR) repeat protein